MPAFEHTDEYKPFRWDLSKREQLPRLIAISDEWTEDWLAFEAELRLCAAKTETQDKTGEVKLILSLGMPDHTSRW